MVVEPVGNEIFLNLRRDDAPIVMRVAPCALPEIGSMLEVGIRVEGLHLFDAATEQRIG